MLWYVRSLQINRVVYKAIKEKAWLHEANEVDNEHNQLFHHPYSFTQYLVRRSPIICSVGQ